MAIAPTITSHLGVPLPTPSFPLLPNIPSTLTAADVTLEVEMSKPVPLPTLAIPTGSAPDKLSEGQSQDLGSQVQPRASHCPRRHPMRPRHHSPLISFPASSPFEDGTSELTSYHSRVVICPQSTEGKPSPSRTGPRSQGRHATTFKQSGIFPSKVVPAIRTPTLGTPTPEIVALSGTFNTASPTPPRTRNRAGLYPFIFISSSSSTGLGGGGTFGTVVVE